MDSEKAVYLTFDDGPRFPSTGRVLDVLRRHRATATFFPVGGLLDANSALGRRIVEEGHAIGNHTYSHADLSRASVEEFDAEVERGADAIRRITGVTTRWLRPPYGRVNGETRALAAERGYELVLWDVDTHDWRSPGVDAIVEVALAETTDGAIVLMHDDVAQTPAALDQLLPALEAQGYAFRALPRDPPVDLPRTGEIRSDR